MPSEKTLKRIVIILGVLLIGGFLALVGIIIFRAVNLGQDSDPQQTSSPVLTLPEEKTPVGISSQRPVTILKVKTPEGVTEELVFDAQSGEYLGKLVRED